MGLPVETLVAKQGQGGSLLTLVKIMAWLLAFVLLGSMSFEASNAAVVSSRGAAALGSDEPSNQERNEFLAGFLSNMGLKNSGSSTIQHLLEENFPMVPTDRRLSDSAKAWVKNSTKSTLMTPTTISSMTNLTHSSGWDTITLNELTTTTNMEERGTRAAVIAEADMAVTEVTVSVVTEVTVSVITEAMVMAEATATSDSMIMAMANTLILVMMIMKTIIMATEMIITATEMIITTTKTTIKTVMKMMITIMIIMATRTSTAMEIRTDTTVDMDVTGIGIMEVPSTVHIFLPTISTRLSFPG